MRGGAFSMTFPRVGVPDVWGLSGLRTRVFNDKTNSGELREDSSVAVEHTAPNASTLAKDHVAGLWVR